jgi:hypothetical protein
MISKSIYPPFGLEKRKSEIQVNMFMCKWNQWSKLASIENKPLFCVPINKASGTITF